ncbi:MAG TPA: hypothetical protein VGH20_08460 [Myxococcales bacterium]|jgi:hypothetical protein
MIKTIPIVNLSTGRVHSRPSTTKTFDLPDDFDRESAVAALDSHSNAHYRSVQGKESSQHVLSRPLSWRVRGEQCLVADNDAAPTPVKRVSYTMCTVQV